MIDRIWSITTADSFGESVSSFITSDRTATTEPPSEATSSESPDGIVSALSLGLTPAVSFVESSHDPDTSVKPDSEEAASNPNHHFLGIWIGKSTTVLGYLLHLQISQLDLH